MITFPQKVDETKPVLLIMPLLLFLGAVIFDYFTFFIGATAFYILSAIFCIINTFFNKSLGILHIFILVCLIASIIGSKEHLSDLPVYISRNYEVIEGIVLVSEGQKGNSIYVNGVHFGYNVPQEIDNSYGGKNIKLWYLPHTKIIMKWKVFSN